MMSKSGMMFTQETSDMRPIVVDAEWDEEALVWVATSNDVPGLATEAESIESLRTKLMDLIPELIAENGLAAGKDRSLPVEILARRLLTIDAA